MSWQVHPLVQEPEIATFVVSVNLSVKLEFIFFNIK